MNASLFYTQFKNDIVVKVPFVGQQQKIDILIVLPDQLTTAEQIKLNGVRTYLKSKLGDICIRTTDVATVLSLENNTMVQHIVLFGIEICNKLFGRVHNFGDKTTYNSIPVFVIKNSLTELVYLNSSVKMLVKEDLDKVILNYENHK